MRHACGPADAERLDRIWFETDATPVVGLVQAPTALYYCTGWEKEEIEAVHQLARRLPTAEVISVPGRSLAPWAGNAEQLGVAIREFVAGVESRSASSIGFSRRSFSPTLLARPAGWSRDW